MINIAVKYNLKLFNLIVVAPFAAYFMYNYLNTDFKSIVQTLSYIGIFLIILLRDKNHPIRFPTYLFFYLLFILYTFYADLIGLHREFKVAYLLKNYILGGFNFMFIIENLRIPNTYFSNVIKVSKYILIFAFFVIVYQQAFDHEFMVMEGLIDEEAVFNASDNRLLSIYSYLGRILGAGLAFVPIFILTTEIFYKQNKKILIWLLMGAIFAFLTKARWTMVFFSLVFLLFVFNKNLKKLFRYILILPLIISISFSALSIVGINAQGILEERILETNKKNFNETSASTRLLAFKAFDKLYWKNPVFGTGDVKYGMGGTGEQSYELRRILGGRSSQIHVGYLSLFYLYGLVGGILFLLFLFFLLKRLYKDGKITGYWSPFIVFIGFSLNNFTEVNFSVFEMGLLVVLFANTYFRTNLLNKDDRKNKELLQRS